MCFLFFKKWKMESETPRPSYRAAPKMTSEGAGGQAYISTWAKNYPSHRMEMGKDGKRFDRFISKSNAKSASG